MFFLKKEFRWLKNIYHLGQGVLACVWHGFPAKNLTIIGVTGTDGKTTTSSIIFQLLKASGKKVAMISTVGAYIGDKVYDVGFHVTTPSSFAVQKYLHMAKNEGVTHVVLEVTSHALDQNRVWGIHFAVGVLTNITHEHLDYHQTYDAYLRAKAKLFQSADVSILNADDESYDRLKKILIGKQTISYGQGYKAEETNKKYALKTNLFGKFNDYNALAAFLVAKHLGVSEKIIRNTLLHIKAPKGRQEVVYKKAFQVMVDFAHTPNAFHELLPDLAQLTGKRIIHVFGSAGKRDKSKRPLMGKESSHFAKIIILTAEDPRDESVMSISEEIAQGFSGWKQVDVSYIPKAYEAKIYYIVENRKEAIGKAIKIASVGDTVLITGKGHETSMNYGAGEQTWSEYEVIQDALIEKK